MGCFHKALPNVKSAYVTLQKFTPDLQKIYTDISAVSVTLCNSGANTLFITFWAIKSTLKSIFYIWLLTFDIWQLSFENWQLTFEIWQLTFDILQLTFDNWHLAGSHLTLKWHEMILLNDIGMVIIAIWIRWLNNID